MSVVLDKGCDVLDPLFNIQVFEVKPSKLRASIDNSARKVSIIP